MINGSARTEATPSSSLQLSSIVTGAVIALLADLAFTLLGAGVGLILFSPEDLAFPQGITLATIILFTGVETVGVFFLGGYVAARMSRTTDSRTGAIQGVASFGIAALVITAQLGPVILLFLGPLLSASAVLLMGFALIALGTFGSAWGGKHATQKREVVTAPRRSFRPAHV